MHLVCLIHNVDIGDLPAFKPKQISVHVSDSDFLLVTVAPIEMLLICLFDACVGGRYFIPSVSWLVNVQRHVQLRILNHQVKKPLVEFKRWLVVILFDKLITFTTLVLQEQIPSEKDRIPEQDSVDLLYFALFRVLANKAPLELSSVFSCPFVL